MEMMGLKWMVMPTVIEGLPIFNFSILITHTLKYKEVRKKKTGTKWKLVYDGEEQVTGFKLHRNE